MSRRSAFLSALVLLFAGAPGPAVSQNQAFVTLPELRNLVRPLLIFAPTSDDVQFQVQVRTFEENSRKTHQLALLPIGVPYQNAPPTSAEFTDADARSARSRFNIAPDEFAVILINKMGSEVYRARRPLSLQEIEQMIKSAAHDQGVR